MGLLTPDPEDEGTPFEAFDIKYLIGTGLIAWAFSASLVGSGLLWAFLTAH